MRYMSNWSLRDLNSWYTFRPRYIGNGYGD